LSYCASDAAAGLFAPDLALNAHLPAAVWMVSSQFLRLQVYRACPTDNLEICLSVDKVTARLGHPTSENFFEAFKGNWLGKVIVHSRFQTFFPVAFQCACGNSDYRRSLAGPFRLCLPDSIGRLPAVEIRHAAIHKYEFV